MKIYFLILILLLISACDMPKTDGTLNITIDSVFIQPQKCSDQTINHGNNIIIDGYERPQLNYSNVNYEECCCATIDNWQKICACKKRTQS